MLSSSGLDVSVLQSIASSIELERDEGKFSKSDFLSFGIA